MGIYGLFWYPDVICTGLCLTIADSGKEPINIYGPDGIASYMHSTRHFMGVSDGRLRVSPNEGLTDTKHQCDNVTIHALRFAAQTCQINSEMTSTHACYIGQTAEVAGKFDVARAKAVGLPKGPLYGMLKNGKSVTLADGTVIEPSDVLGPSEPSRYFAIVCDMTGPYEGSLLKSVSSHAFFQR